MLQKLQARFLQIDDNNGDPEVAVRRDGVEAVTERGSAVELRGDPGHGDQSDGGGDDVELHVAQPCQILQVGITQEVNCHQRYDDLVHGRLLLIAYPIDRRGHAFCNGQLSEMENASHLNCYVERVLRRS
jgi:hypothetical protein